MKHESFMHFAIDLAAESRRKSNHPFGAILVKDEEIVLMSENTVVTSGDVTQHAELRLVSQASQTLTRQELSQCTLYTSTEPCAMCTGAIYWSGIRSIVFGLPGYELANCTSGSFIVDSKELFRQGRESVAVIGPVLLEQSRRVHESFWSKENKYM